LTLQRRGFLAAAGAAALFSGCVLARDVDALVASSISRAGVESERVVWKVLRHD
jgi:hypothetical protein